jgi:hypothetical protein
LELSMETCLHDAKLDGGIHFISIFLLINLFYKNQSTSWL